MISAATIYAKVGRGYKYFSERNAVTAHRFAIIGIDKFNRVQTRLCGIVGGSISPGNYNAI
jgi:hypothetical protein